MRLRLLSVSHRQPSWVLEGCAEYEKRLPRTWQFTQQEIKPEARTGGADTAKVQAAEARRLSAAVPAGARVIALDERGETWSTLQFAEQLAKWLRDARDLAFVIGGADGLDPDFRAAADQRMALSRLTLPHGLVRVVFVEQLYRAASVLDGHPYHK